MVSVPSFGDSFFIPGVLAGYSLHYYCFRPLIRGFFFYLWDICGEIATDKEEFPSPHSGILFLYRVSWGL